MSYNHTTQHEIHVMHFNAQGITNPSYILELEHILNERKIDIVFINETFLKPKHKFKLRNYAIYREDRPTHGGGVLIAIKNNIPHQRVPKIATSSLENISITIYINKRPVRLTSAYCPKYTTNFINDLDKITRTTEEYFIFGDFNAHHTSWNCCHNNAAGRSLYGHQINSNYYIHSPNDFTRFTQRQSPQLPSVVDLLLTNSCLQFSQVKTHPNLLKSDHTPMTCRIFGPLITKSVRIPLYHKANWKSISKYVTNEIKHHNFETAVITQLNVDNILSKITNIIQQAESKIPVGEKVTWQKRLSRLSLYLIGQRKRFRRRLQRSYNLSERNMLICLLKQLDQLIEYHVQNDRNISWYKFLRSLPPGKKKFWLLTKAMRGAKPRIEVLTQDGADVYNNFEKANIIAEVFEDSHKISTNTISGNEEGVIRHVEWLDRQITPQRGDHEPISIDEVKRHVKNLKNAKAPGLDGIKPIVLKKMPDSLFKIVTNIFNWCLGNSYFPKLFKVAKVVPILKKGKDSKIPKSYRPISMLNCLDKVFEKIIFQRLIEFTENNSILKEEQFGFRKQHSTTHQVKRIVNIIDSNKRQRKSTGIVFLDIEKAFDSIWHNGLIFKLQKFGYPIYLQKIIKSFLSKRTFIVHIDDAQSSPGNIPAGVPQGSVLSPILYSIYTSDFKTLQYETAALYADDTALMVTGKVSNAIIKKMKKSIIHVRKYFTKWKIKINEEKTQAIIFPYNKSPKRIPNIPLNISGADIPLQKSIKYLGIILDKNLTFKDHILHTSDKAIKCGRALFPLMNRKSHLSIKNKLLIYKMCIRPIMTYGCQVWSTRCAKTYYKKLQVIQNKNLKNIFGLNMRYSTLHLHQRFHEDMLSTFVDKITEKFECRNRLSNYRLLRELHD